MTVRLFVMLLVTLVLTGCVRRSLTVKSDPPGALVYLNGVEVDYRYKLESIDLWETVVITNNKSALPELQQQQQTIAA